MIRSEIPCLEIQKRNKDRPVRIRQKSRMPGSGTFSCPECSFWSVVLSAPIYSSSVFLIGVARCTDKHSGLPTTPPQVGNLQMTKQSFLDIVKLCGLSRSARYRNLQISESAGLRVPAAVKRMSKSTAWFLLGAPS